MGQKPSWMRPHGPNWSADKGKVVYDNPWITVTESRPIAPTGQQALYGVVHMKNLALGVLPLHDDGTVTLVGQHRYTFGDYSWELPEGGGPLGTDPLANIQRELAEEAGLAAADWRRIVSFRVSNSVTTEQGLGYLATGLTAIAAHQADDTEVIALARVPFREALDQALCGNIDDLITVALLLRAYHMAREGELPSALTAAML